MIKTLSGIAAVTAALLCIPVVLYLYALGPFPHPSIEFGYYGQFNQVSRIIRSISGVTIVDSWQHHDLTMEDFRFTVTLPDGTIHDINFWEGSPQMSLNRDADIERFVLNEIGGAR